MLKTFSKFMRQDQDWDMFITGQAGTGKTTSLAQLVEYCHNAGINAVVCAYTHKACGILASKLPQYAKIQTLHSFLRKRPTINKHATHHKNISSNAQVGDPTRVQVLFVDEFSMIGEKDFMDIRALQDPDYDGEPEMKVVWIGDLNQLPPVGDMQTIVPHKPYWVELKEIHRQAQDNPLIKPLTQLVEYINGDDPEPLEESEAFVRGQDIVEWYVNDRDAAGYTDQVILAYTNERVQQLNQDIEGRDYPVKNDKLFSPTTQHHYTFFEELPVDQVASINLPFGEELTFNSKYKTLEHLLKMGCCQFMSVSNPIDDEPDITLAVVFGHYSHKLKLMELKKAAAQANKAIEDRHHMSAAAWAKANPTNKLARARAKAWRDFLTFNDCVICLDFSHAMTVHKSQGSTYEYVYVDTNDLARCADFDYTLYLKLMYVAISRASKRVITS